MYTNIDSFNNKRVELEAIIALNNPDVIGLTEVNPKNSTWSLQQQQSRWKGSSAVCEKLSQVNGDKSNYGL